MTGADASTGQTHSADKPAEPQLRARDLSLGYDRRTLVLEHLSIDITPGAFTIIIGGNGCGKSTLLRGLGRMLGPRAGHVDLHGRDAGDWSPKAFAREVAMLPQGPIAPEGITVADLVSRGRFPHQRLLRAWSPDDETALAHAMTATGVDDLREHRVEELSGGQRQRVWLAMSLAQQTDILLLDEPTTFLDIAHQIEVLELCASLRETVGRTLVAVLHDINHACRYATHLVAMKDGRVVAQGPPGLIVTAELIEDVFGLACLVMPDPVTGTPMVVPQATRRS